MAYTYYAQITIQSSEVPADQTDFPVLISGTYDGSGGEPDLRTTGNGGNIENTASGGASGSVTVPADFVFSPNTDGSNPYDFEIVNYDPATGLIEAWVRIPSLASGSDTTFYMAFGDSGVTTSQENVGGTWNSNFLGVYHQGESSGTVYDSSGNNNDSTAEQATNRSATGQVGNADDFELDNSDYHTLPAIAVGTGGTGTMMCWFNAETFPGSGRRAMIARNFGNVELAVDSNDILVGLAWSGTTLFGGTSLSTATWYHAVFTSDGTDAFLFLNGSQDATANDAQDWRNETDPWAIGAYDDTGGDHFDGVIDEVMILSAGIDSDFATTIYNTMNDPGAFYTVGTQQGGVTTINANTGGATAAGQSASVTVAGAPQTINANTGGATAAGQAATVSTAAIYYVDATNGSDSNDGLSPGSAWQTISHVNSQTFNPGDQVLFKRGETWTGTQLTIDESGTSGSPITFGAYDTGTDPIIENSGSNFERCVRLNGDYLTVEDMWLRNTHEAGVGCYGTNCTVQRCEISDCGTGVAFRGTDGYVNDCYIHDLTMIVNDEGGDNDYGAVAIWFYSNNCLAENITAENCRAESFDYGHDGGVFELFGTNVDDNEFRYSWGEQCEGGYETGGGSNANMLVHHNVFHNNFGRCGTMHLENDNFEAIHTNFQFHNNTVVEDNAGYLFWFGGVDPHGELHFINNIFVADGGTVWWEDGADHQYNLYHTPNGGSINATLGTGEITGDPLFADEGNDDFHLASGSPAVDAGTSLGYSQDYDGTSIPQGPSPDIGAFERDAGPIDAAVGQLTASGPQASVVGTYYVDATGGSDSNDGLTPSTAWATIGHVNNQSFNPGDRILFKRGETWSGETLEITWAGNATAGRIRFADYDSGNLPVIDGGAGYAVHDATGYDYIELENLDLTADGQVIFLDDFDGANDGSSYWNVSNCTIRGPNTFYGHDHVWRGNTIDGSANSSNDQGIEDKSGTGEDQSHDNLYENNTVHDFTSRGIWFQGKGHDNTARNNTVYNITGSTRGQGINSDGYDSIRWNDTIEDNLIYDVDDLGIQLENCFQCVVRRNEVRDCSTAGDRSSASIYLIQYELCDTGGGFGSTSDCRGLDSETEVFNNLCYDGGDEGIHTEECGGLQIWHNTIVRHYRHGVDITNDVSGYTANDLRDNIISQNGNGSGDYEIAVVEWGALDPDDYNLLDPRHGAYEQKVSPFTQYLTLSDYQSGEGHGANSIQTSNPGFVDAGNDNFDIVSTSPAVDAGTDVGVSFDIDQNTRPSGAGFDMGAYEYQAVGANISAALKILASNGEQATVSAGAVVSANVGNLTAAGQAATAATTIIANVGQLTAAGNPGVVVGNVRVTANTGQLTASGQAASIITLGLVTADVGQLTAAGEAGTITAGAVIQAGTGAAKASGEGADVTAGALIAANVGQLTAAGETATAKGDIVIGAGLGALTLAGQQATWQGAYTLQAGAGALTAAGPQATAKGDIRISANLGQLTTTADPATWSGLYTVAGGFYEMALTGQQATIAGGALVSAGFGSLAATAEPATVAGGAVVQAGTGELTTSTEPGAVTGGALVSANAGQLTAASFAAAIIANVVIPANLGAITTAGEAATWSGLYIVDGGLGQASVGAFAGSVIPGATTISANVGALTAAGEQSEAQQGGFPKVDMEEGHRPWIDMEDAHT